ncbi:MAG: peptide chain release factor N(5)-glutamine methyltransferase [Cyanobacteria bacterium P01_D01_bin.123]
MDVPDLDQAATASARLWAWRNDAIARARCEGIAPVEVDRLLAHFTGWTNRDRLLGSYPSEVDWLQLNSSWQRRWQERVPLHYVLGTLTWRDLDLQVSPAVLIPRPETELLVDLALPEVRAASENSLWVDLGTGSGAIAIALARERADVQVHAVDLSAEAIEVAAANVRFYELAARVQLWLGSWFEPLSSLRGQIRGVVSNPPYIPTAEINTLQPEVRQHEPHLALDGGHFGLDAIVHLIQTAPDYVMSEGFWAVELMVGQARTVTQLLQRDGRYRAIAVHPDLGGIDRFVSARIV